MFFVRSTYLRKVKFQAFISMLHLDLQAIAYCLQLPDPERVSKSVFFFGTSLNLSLHKPSFQPENILAILLYFDKIGPFHWK